LPMSLKLLSPTFYLPSFTTRSSISTIGVEDRLLSCDGAD
jgi:hypothetical protein